ncbi:MAG: hypothetical protein NC321_03985 [Clostridium sp.]|nr:hypothetical protein [Clostridium sp.]
MERAEDDEKKSKWQEINCLDDEVILKLPEDWKKPTDEVIAKKFPYHSKPQEIFADLQKKKIITFNLLDKQLPDEQVYPAIKEMQRLINRLYPESIRKEARLFKVEAGMSGRFTFITGGMEYDTAHCMFILPVNERMMFGSYHFPLEEMAEEEAVLLDILRSICVISSTEDEAENYERTGIHRQRNTRA